MKRLRESRGYFGALVALDAVEPKTWSAVARLRCEDRRNAL